MNEIRPTPYATTDELIAHMEERGEYTDDMVGKESAALIKAKDKLDTVSLDYSKIEPDNPPAALVKANIVLAVKVLQGTKLFNDYTSDSSFLKKEKIDVLEFEYSVPNMEDGVIQPSFPEVEALLAGLMVSGYTGRMRVQRA